MANLNETAQWETGIYQLETSDPVMGGPDGIDNRQAKQLANRTLWLKNQTEALQTATAGKAASATTVTAGNGLTGGGNLTASRTISLGQPGQITAQSQNAVQSSGHTHAIDTATTSRAGIVQLADRVSANTAEANKAITTAAVNRAIDELSENVLGRIGQANTRIDTAVTLTGDQTITGAKIFQSDIKASASTAHAAADRYIRLGADATGAYAVNSKSSKILYLRHDGNLTYDGHNVLLARDISSAVNLNDSNKVASAAAVKTAYDAATAASAAVQNMALTGNAAENGWLKLPNGILMQWGKTTIEGVHRQKEIFFPVAFREIYSIASSAYLPNATYWGNMSGGVVIRSYTKNKFAAQVSSSYEDRAGTDTCILWFAVGKAA